MFKDHKVMHFLCGCEENILTFSGIYIFPRSFRIINSGSEDVLIFKFNGKTFQQIISSFVFLDFRQVWNKLKFHFRASIFQIKYFHSDSLNNTDPHLQLNPTFRGGHLCFLTSLSLTHFWMSASLQPYYFVCLRYTSRNLFQRSGFSFLKALIPIAKPSFCNTSATC